MSAKLGRNICKFLINFEEQLNKPVQRLEFSELSGRSFLTTDRALKGKLEASFLIDPQNAKQLQKIEKKAKQLKQKQKRQRNYLKRIKKLYEDQVKQFGELEKITKQALEEKSKEVQFLNMQNSQLKEQRNQLNTLRQQKQSLVTKIEQLEIKNTNLNQELCNIQQNYNILKNQYEQQADLLEKGIRQNQVQAQPSTPFTTPYNLQQVQQINQNLQKIKQDQQTLRNSLQKINAFNLKLNTLLNLVDQSNKVSENKHQKSEQISLIDLADKLTQKTDKISTILVQSQKIEKQLKIREEDVIILNAKFKYQQNLAQQRLTEIFNCKQQIQVMHDIQKMNNQTQRQNKQQKAKNFQRFEQKMQNLFEDKMLKQHSTIYQTFSNTAKQIFTSYSNELNDANQKFIQSALKTIESNLLKLNEYFKQKAQRDIERIQKMVGFMKNANQIIQKNQDQYEYEKQKDNFNVSTPQRFSMAPITHHRRQQSESSAQSKKKSIVLEEDLDSALNLAQQIDQIKQQALQKELSDMKNSQIIVDSLNDGNGSEGSNTVKDAISQSSFTKSKISEMSQVEQQKAYTTNLKNAKLNAKLKKKKK